MFSGRSPGSARSGRSLDAQTSPNQSGWDRMCDAVSEGLEAYASAQDDGERRRALERLHTLANTLDTVAWPPAAGLGKELRRWLRPRIRLEQAGLRLVADMDRLPRTTAEDRARWVEFLREEVNRPFHEHDAARTVVQRVEALAGIHATLDKLKVRNRSDRWAPAMEVEAALGELFGEPNLAVVADLASLRPALDQPFVTDGPITRKGYTSQITAGPKSGFGLISSDDGIVFYTRQKLSGVTPIWDFQQKLLEQPMGCIIGKIYEFHATTTDRAEATLVVAIRNEGMTITPSNTHNFGLEIWSVPQPCSHAARSALAALCLTQEKINRLIWQNAFPEVVKNGVKEAQEESQERADKVAAERNAQLRRYLPGTGQARYDDLLIDGLTLQTRPDFVRLGGTLGHIAGHVPFGADAPKPAALLQPEPGVTLDVHLSSALSNLIRGSFVGGRYGSVTNVMVVSKNIPAGAPRSSAFEVTFNADDATYRKAVDAARAVNDPKVLAVRVRRPSRSPEVGVDATGKLVFVIDDLEVEMSVPPDTPHEGLPPAKILRVKAKRVEVALNFLVTARTAKEPVRLDGEIASIDVGPLGDLQAEAIDKDDRPTALTELDKALLVGQLRAQAQGQKVDIPLSNLQLEGFAIQSITPLDPSGWVRAVLVRTSNSPAAGIR